jgi:radical SAM-linked protein
MTTGEFRLRVCYAKTGRLMWLSHLEVVRALERTVRRSGLSYAVTSGFNPHMKAAFGPALPVGTAGDGEYLDVWLTRYTESSEALDRLAKAAATDLRPLQASYVDDRSPALTVALTIARYRVEMMGGFVPTEVHGALQRVLAEGRLEIEHKGKTKFFDLARSVPEDPRVEEVEGGVRLYLTVRMGPEGSLRPLVLVNAILTDIGSEASAVRTTRLDLLTESQEGVWSRPV